MQVNVANKSELLYHFPSAYLAQILSTDIFFLGEHFLNKQKKHFLEDFIATYSKWCSIRNIIGLQKYTWPWSLEENALH